MKKPRTKTEMVAYLKGHFRYDTENSWNHASSYAAKVKVHSGWIPCELMDKAYEMLEQRQVFAEIEDLFDEFAREYNWSFQPGWAGRSGGYIVLRRGGSRPSQYKSYCTNCGQRNFTSTTENSKQCGVCSEHKRVDYENPPLETYMQPGLGLDDDTDFADWDLGQLKDRVDMVFEFDKLVEKAKATFLDFCRRFDVVEEEIMVPKKVKVLKEVG